MQSPLPSPHRLQTQIADQLEKRPIKMVVSFHFVIEEVSLELP